MSNNEKNLITFTSDGLDADDLLVTRLEGRDRISDLFCYELELVSKKAGIDIDKVLESSAHLGIKQGVQMAGSDKRGKRTVQIHGMVAMFEQADKRHDQVNYRAVLVPRMWKLTRNFVSQVYLDSDVPKIIAANLKAAGLEEGTDFEFRLGGDYTVREYVVQYEETDYDFICRWMEHEGIWFFFEQHPDGEKLVLADSAANYRDIVGNPELAYRPQIAGDNARGEVRETDSASDDWFAEEVITSVTARKEIIPKEVKLKDYNWRNPADPLEGTAPAAEKGVGTFYEYNDHYKTKAEGDALAKVRAGEWQSREFRFRGSSDCRSFQAGATFSLNDHYRPDFNQRYLLVEVEHVATQSVSLASTSEGGAGSTTGTYRNRYVAIPADRDFRPERRTAWPSIKGVIHAMVEASGDDKLADLNDDGAYRVRLPWDIANADKGKGQASRWIRMAQQYSGPGYGSHFPLHAGTEVLLTHIDGDPDRPIISATVPNRNNPSPVNKKNKGKNVVRSASGNMIEMDDNEGSEGMVFMNGAGTVVKAWRNKAAGGTGGAGGVTQPKGKAMTPDDVTAMVTPLLAMGADQLSPRVGLFSGPMANASLDAGDMVPDLMKLAADAGGAGFDAGAFADAMRSMTQRSADGGNGVDAGAFADVMRSMTQRSPDGGRAGGNSSQKSSPAGGGTASEAPAPIRPAPEPERDEDGNPKPPAPPETPEPTMTEAEIRKIAAEASEACMAEPPTEYEADETGASGEGDYKDDAEAAFFSFGREISKSKFHTYLNKVAPGADAFAQSPGNGSKVRDDASSFEASTSAYSYSEGANLSVNVGHAGSYQDGDQTSIAKGKKSSSLTEYDAVTDRTVVNGARMTHEFVGGVDMSVSNKTGVEASIATVSASMSQLTAGVVLEDSSIGSRMSTTKVGADLSTTMAAIMQSDTLCAGPIVSNTIAGAQLDNSIVAGPVISNSVSSASMSTSVTGAAVSMSTAAATLDLSTVGAAASMFIGNNFGLTVGTDVSFTAGYSSALYGGLKLDCFLGAAFSVALAMKLDILLGGAMSITAGGKIDILAGIDMRLSPIATIAIDLWDIDFATTHLLS